MPDTYIAGRNIAMGAVRVTEAAAIAASKYMGKGDDTIADRAAVAAMHRALSSLAVDGLVRIGEGREGECEHLFVGEKVGNGTGPEVDVALKALEGATIIAKGEPNGLSCIAMTERGGFLDAPDIYMEKIAVGGGLPADTLDLGAAPLDNLQRVAEAKGIVIEDLVVCILDRPRHRDLIAKVREAGARIMLIADGDVSGVIATTWPESGVDVYMGIGGAQQGVLAAAALRGVGGQIQARFVIRSEDDRKACRDHGITDLDRIYSTEDMAAGDVTFAATGITGGPILAGVRRVHGVAVTHSLVMRSKTGTLRSIEAFHNFAQMADGQDPADD